MAFSSGLFSAFTQSPQPGAEPGDSCWTGWCQVANRGRGRGAGYLCSVIVSADSRFPLVSAWNLTPVLRCAQCGYIQSPFGSTPMEESFQPYASRWQRKRNRLVAWVGDDAWGPNPRLPSNSLYTVSELRPASCSTWCHRTSALLLGWWAAGGRGGGGGGRGVMHRSHSLEFPPVG